MMRTFYDKEVFPADVQQVIIRCLDNPAASSCSDMNLFRVLQKYDTRPQHIVSVESLAPNTLFRMKNGRVFRKEGLIRKRFRCTEIATGRVYLFNPLAEVSVAD